MLANRGRDTAPELRIRSLVHRSGLRFRVDARPLPRLRRTADLVFRPVEVAVFVDGCYWHGCPEHFVQPKTNSYFWKEKIGRNIERDRDTDSIIRDAGWTVIRIWEHEEPEAAAGEIVELVRRKRAERHSGH
jgi:DNA mismatch endonuclease (patch repair protein)